MKKQITQALAIGGAAMLALTGCTAAATDSESAGSVSIGYVTGWTDGESVAYLYKNQFEKMGYEVEVTSMSDNGPLYAGVAGGDIDIFASGAPEVMQADYWNEFGDDMEDLVTWYDGMLNLIAVPSYSSINSLEELADNVDTFNGEIIGIEPGAGLTQATEEGMIPAYGLEDSYTLRTSSTATMLTVLSDAIENGEDIAVTLWKPFWAFNQYDVKALEDPLLGMGEAEGAHTMARAGFTEDFPELAEYIAGVSLDDSTYGPLETLVVSEEYEGDPAGAVAEWLTQHADAYPGILTE